MPQSPRSAFRLPAHCLTGLAMAMLLASPGCGGGRATGGGTAAPPVAVKAMPPIPDLSKVRIFTETIPGLPTTKVGLAAATLQRLGDLKYPEAAWNQGLQGWAVFDFVVAPDGSVDPKYVRLVAASNDLFAPPAEAAVRAGRFTPASQGGKAVATLVRLPVYFSLDQAARRP
jgi:TonB family protein